MPGNLVSGNDESPERPERTTRELMLSNSDDASADSNAHTGNTGPEAPNMLRTTPIASPEYIDSVAKQANRMANDYYNITEQLHTWTGTRLGQVGIAMFIMRTTQQSSGLYLAMNMMVHERGPAAYIAGEDNITIDEPNPGILTTRLSDLAFEGLAQRLKNVYMDMQSIVDILERIPEFDPALLQLVKENCARALPERGTDYWAKRSREHRLIDVEDWCNHPFLLL